VRDAVDYVFERVKAPELANRPLASPTSTG
jgi:hypothetical protein